MRFRLRKRVREHKTCQLEGKTMDEHDREEVALFRYGLIAPLLHGSVEDKADYLAEVSSRVYQVPYCGKECA